MIPSDWLDQVPDALVELYANAETEILCDMADRISHMDFYNASVQWQEQMLQEMGLEHDYIISKLSGLTSKTTEELEALIANAGAEVLRTNAYLADAGYNLASVSASEAWKARLTEGLKKTGKLFKNLTRTTASVGSAQFRQACDMAYMQVESGAFSPKEAISNAVRRLSRDGLQTIEYHKGGTPTRREQVDVAVRRAVLTGVNQTTAGLQLTVNEELGLDLVELSAHEGARPEHAEWQGKIYSLSGSSKKYKDFYQATGFGTGEGLCGWNCRHTFAPFAEGTTPVWSQTELDKLNARMVEYNGEQISYYEATQKQRYIERQIRRYKREVLACNAADVPNGRASERLAYWNRTQNDFIEQTGFKKQFDRTSVKQYTNTIKKPYGLARQKGNKGAFSHLPEKMSKAHIRDVAKDCGISLKGITLEIDNSEHWLRIGTAGIADSSHIGTIIFTPNAFKSREELIRTIVHEKKHIEQYKELGVNRVLAESAFYDDEAYATEDAFVEWLKSRGKI